MKSVHTLLAEAHDTLRLDPAKMKQYRELVPITVGTPIEVQLNCANAILAGKIKEAAGAVRNMGREHNRVTELRESAEAFTETERPDKTRLQKHLVNRGILSEAEASALNRLRKGEDALGNSCTYLDPAMPAGLSESDAKTYKFALAIGFTESQALHYAKQPKTAPAKPGRF